MQPTLKVLAGLVMLLVWGHPTLAQNLPSNVPLPADIQVVQPSEALPAEVKSFSGRWVGAWDGTLDHVLVVEEIASPDRVTAVYAWGTNQYVTKSGFSRLRGKITSGKLELRFPNGASANYVLGTNDELRGEYEKPGNLVRATMKRVRE